MIKRLLLSFIIAFTILFKPVMAQISNQDALANQFYNNGDYAKALTIYKNLYQSKNGSSIYYREYLNTLLKLKLYNDAEKIIQKEIKQNPIARLDLGALYQEKGDLASADKIYDGVVKEMQPDQFAINDVANAFYGTGNFDYAIKTLVEGRRLLKDNGAFAFELINLYRYKKMKEELTQEVLNLVDTQPEMLPMAKASLSKTYENNDDYNILKSLLLKKIQKNPQNTNYINLLAWQYMQQQQFDLALIQLIALDKRTNGNGGQLFSFADLLIENKAYATANKVYDYLISKGPNSTYYIASRVAILRCKNKQILEEKYTKEDILGLVADYEKLLAEFGSNAQTIFAIRQLANLKAFYLNQLDDAQQLLENAINFPNSRPETVAQIKLDLADIYILNNERWEAALLYGQVEKSFTNEELGQEAKFKNAKLSFYNGDFTWAKAQLDVLKASTSQLIANDALDLSLLIQDNLVFDTTGNALKLYAKADLLQYKNLNDQSLTTLDSIAVLYPQTDLLDDILMLKAKIYTKQKDFTKAADTYKSLISNYNQSIWADDALFQLGVLENDKLNDKTNAQKHFDQLINDYPGSLYTIEARKRFRILRGDTIN
ncbi:tetratricopeptide repeat protein [Pedobacter sp. SD-b]|uniref:Tetratricopeptide repeat protein n=1 Tax=Pedobacter segetis TaxID=2793069 RepID=A0ABS1BKB8_9SPHI|nr:tetratricopeptide repeat protein [Pedobacter segetis]MBK0383181.1 tetratricopeptide repeat protein [Pedobacter segetis]